MKKSLIVLFIVALLVLGLIAYSDARTKRNKAARSQFMKLQPCPSTGKSRGACPGYIIDHIIPMKRGGADSPDNMQWQTMEEAREKDKWE